MKKSKQKGSHTPARRRLMRDFKRYKKIECAIKNQK
jgi:hypothetical protein